MIEPRTLTGFMELLPQDQILFNQIVDTIRRNYEKYGFLPLDTPVIESSEVLLAKAGGDTEKQIYRFKKGDNDLCLRFDHTVPLAKYVALHNNQLTFPFARYQIGKVYRGEKPQKGRFREFYQCDIDVIGKDKLSLVYDAEIPSIIYSIFKELQLGDFEIKISNRKLLIGLLQSLDIDISLHVEILRLIDKINKIGQENFMSTLSIDYNIPSEKIAVIVDFLKISGDVDNQIVALKNLNINNETFTTGVSELEFVARHMRMFGISEDNFTIDTTIARGLDYYTGTVYETFLKGYEFLGSVSSGGRFDNLASFYTKDHLPGVGMSIGLTRLFYKLQENNLLNDSKNSISRAIIIPLDDNIEECIKLSNYLRNNNINNEIYLENAKFKTKMNYAVNRNIKYAIFIGEDEIKNGYYTVKNLNEFQQSQVKLDDILQVINQ